MLWSPDGMKVKKKYAQVVFYIVIVFFCTYYCCGFCGQQLKVPSLFKTSEYRMENGEVICTVGPLWLVVRDLDWKCIIVGIYDYSGKPEQVSLVTRIPLHYRIHFLLYLLLLLWLHRKKQSTHCHLVTGYLDNTTALTNLPYQSICYTPKAPLATNFKWVHIIILTSFKEFRGKWNLTRASCTLDIFATVKDMRLMAYKH